MKKTISKVKAAHYEAQGSIAMREHADHHYGEKTPRLGLLMLFCKDFFQTLFNCK